MANNERLANVTFDILSDHVNVLRFRYRGHAYSARLNLGVDGKTPSIEPDSFHRRDLSKRDEYRNIKSIDPRAVANVHIVGAALEYVKNHNLVTKARAERAAQEQFEAARSRVLTSIGRRRQMAETLYGALQEARKPVEAIALGEIEVRKDERATAKQLLVEIDAALDAADEGPRVRAGSFRAENFAQACESGTVEVRGDSGEFVSLPAVAYYGPRKYQGKQFYAIIVATLPCGRRIRHHVDTAIEEMLPAHASEAEAEAREQALEA